MKKDSINFNNDGITLSGWIARPDSDVDAPVIILTHGLSGIIALDIEHYAEIFVAAGFACFAYDHRNWGQSGGWPRCETDPWQQVADLREAISFVRTLPGIDGERLGLWGTSYAGGHVLTVGALDKRVRCVVSQVPLVSGSKTFDLWVPRDKQAKFLERLATDRDDRRSGAPPKTVAAAIEGSETAEWIARNDTDSVYVNQLTVRSFDLLRSYEPQQFVDKLAPTPVMLIIASNDTQTPTQWQRDLYQKLSEPKRLLEVEGRHYDVYMDKLSQAAEAAQQWYALHL